MGNIYMGGFPISGMTAPTGMSVTNTADNNYCMRMTGYSDTARIYAGARSATAPAASIGGGTFYYYDSGTGTYLSKAVTDASLSTLSFQCTHTQTVGGKTVMWRVTVASGGITPASVPAATNQTLSTDSQTRLEQEATVTPIKITFTYQITVNSTDQVYLPGDRRPRHIGCPRRLRPTPLGRVMTMHRARARRTLGETATTSGASRSSRC